MAFVEDVLLKANSLSHHGDLITEEKELTPSLENCIVLTWLQRVHPELPKLEQRYGTKLRSRTLVSTKPKISQALDSLLDEIRASDNAKVTRTATNTFRHASTQRSNEAPTTTETVSRLQTGPVTRHLPLPQGMPSSPKGRSQIHRSSKANR